MSSLMQDLRFAVRSLRRAPGYAAAFILTLALGIGANTAVFSVIQGVILRPLPYRDGERLVYLRHRAERAGIENALFSVPEIDDYRRRAGSFAGVAEFSALTFTVLGLDEPRRVRAGIVSGNYFQVMGLDATLGRVIAPEDDGEAAPPVVVLTHDTWQSLFGGDPTVLQRTVRMNGMSMSIIGVAQPAPPYPERTDLYVNMAASPHHLDATMQHDRRHRMTEVFARLAAGASLEATRAEVDAVTGALHQEHPDAYDATQGYTVDLHRLRDKLTERAGPTLWALFAAAAFVLVIACANVANLILARSVARQDELALRGYLGAGRWRIRSQLVIENLLPALAGALLGLAVAYLGVDALISFASRYSTRASEIEVDVSALAVSVAVAVVAAVLFALLPSLPGARLAAPGPQRRSTGGVASRRLQRVLTVAQIGVCFVLLVGAGLLLRTLLNLQRADAGLETEEVLALEIPATGRGRDENRRFYDDLLRQSAAIPGVRNAALGSFLPLLEAPSGLGAFVRAMQFQIDGSPVEAGATPPRADFRPVSREYFRTLGIELLDGRLFDARDDAESDRVVVINEAMARHHFPDRSPLGQRLAWNDDVIRFIGVSDEWRTVVGVVSSARDYGIVEEVPHVVYHPYLQVPAAHVLFLRSPKPDAVARTAIEVVRRLDPDQPIENVATLAEARSRAIGPERLNATLIGGFALLALVLAMVGVGGVLSFSVGQRTWELGIRAALGADQPRLLRMVLAEALTLAAVGLLLGGAAALVLARLVGGLLYGVEPLDVPTFLAVALALAGVSLAAAWPPASRAAQVEPARALRAD